jgi:hypothetical protein
VSHAHAPLEEIAAEEALFHRPAYRNSDWLETNWFSFYVPERNMRGWVYVGFRSELGVCASTVSIWSRSGHQVIDLDYHDARMQVPMPPSNLDDYQLSTGLAVKMPEPLKRWEISYRGFGDTELVFEANALMPAILSDVTRLPTGDEFHAQHDTGAVAPSNVGHIDQTLEMVGELRLHGEAIPIGFASSRDHSWGPRLQYGHRRGNFDEGYFGDRGTDLAFHADEQPQHEYR